MRHGIHVSRRLTVAAAAAILVASFAGAASPRAVRGRGGAVVSANVQATAAGLEILRHGGNAADAAVATALALAVVHPQAGNLGGGGFAVVRIKGRVTTLDFRETAPAGARHDMFLDKSGQADPERSLIGPLAAGVPGSPDGLYRLQRRYGSLPWQVVVQPAVQLARDGFVVSERLAGDLEQDADQLRRYPDTAAIWLPGGSPPAAGTTMRLPQLAALLSSYAEEGPEAITSGPAAAAVELISRRYGGVLRAHDLKAYQSVWREPVTFNAFGWNVASMDLPSSGGIIIGETVGLLERVGWANLPRFGAVRRHLLVEAWRRAFADRFVLGDPGVTQARATDLLAPSWLAQRAAGIDEHRATRSQEIRPWTGPLPDEHRQTTHLAVIDAFGNVVSLTTTLNGAFGCGVVVPGLGFLLNNEMDDFTAAAGQPNTYGLIQGEANAVGPGKRMLSSMSPTVLWSGDQVLALGAAGGSRIPTATLQVMLNVIVDGDELQAAVDRPRVHHQWLPDHLDAEADALAPETAGALGRMGHRIEIEERLGRVNAVLLSLDGTVAAAADPRGPGAAGVVRGWPVSNSERRPN
jgi:gamma-glutamyltranspeptidase / glutathione hydrolase